MYFYLKCEYISTKKQERYFYQERGKIWPVLMAGLSTLSKVFMYFYLKCEHISMKTGKIFLSRKKKYLASFDGRPLNSWKSVAKLAAAPLLPSLSSNPSSCLIHFNYCKCYFINGLSSTINGLHIIKCLSDFLSLSQSRCALLFVLQIVIIIIIINHDIDEDDDDDEGDDGDDDDDDGL